MASPLSLSRFLSRRRFLVGIAGSAGAAILAACGGNATNTPAGGGATIAATRAGGTSVTGATPAVATSVGSPAGTAAVTRVTGSAVTGTAAVGSAVTGTAGGTVAAGATTYTADNPPSFTGAANAKQYSSQRITYYGDSVGQGAQLDQAAARKFTQETGIAVNVVPKPQSATENYSAYLRFFQAQSPDLDVMMIDVIWPGAFAQHLVDLNAKLGELAKQSYPSIIENNTIDGKLVGMPWFGDFGMLYYRTDLSRKYGFAAPPKTWDELEQQAKQIQDGERAANPNFAGFVFQGNAYEGLTCNALEWLASTGGGQIVENGKVTINNPQAVSITNKARGWVGGIAPKGVTSYQETDTENIFKGGNAAFARNWPYMYAIAQTSDPVRGKFDIAPLPASAGQKNVGTLGGWQLGVSRYSKNQDAAIEFVRYLTSPEVVTWRAVVGSYVPLNQSVAQNPDVLKAQPFLQKLADVTRVTRPSRELRDRYNEGSTRVYQGVNQVLNGQDAAQVLPQVQQQLQRLVP